MTAAHKWETGASGLDTGHVTLLQGARFAVALEAGGEVVARQAASCLLKPAVGDRVLLATVDAPYVLAVLDRDAESPAEISIEGDATLRATGELAFESTRMEVRTGVARLFATGLDAAVSSGKVGFAKLRVAAKAYERVADSVVERAHRVHRFVEELDQVRARHVDYRAEETTQIKGKTTVVTAREVMKIDGETVHIG